MKSMLKLSVLVAGCVIVCAGCATATHKKPAPENVSASATSTEGTSSPESAPPVTVPESHVAACVNPPTPAGPQPCLNDVEILSGSLSCQLDVDRADYQRTPTGTFMVTCTFRNKCNKPLKIQARTQCYNGDMQHQHGPDAWQPVFIPAGGTETYRSYSYGKNLEYFHVEVQRL